MTRDVTWYSDQQGRSCQSHPANQSFLAITYCSTTQLLRGQTVTARPSGATRVLMLPANCPGKHTPPADLRFTSLSVTTLPTDHIQSIKVARLWLLRTRLIGCSAGLDVFVNTSSTHYCPYREIPEDSIVRASKKAVLTGDVRTYQRHEIQRDPAVSSI